ncbi:MAG: hypothetical protein MN733_25565 [Nitrososphaera sp.]|nr:hypothetical protein [Nitrososphaera sp.]
MARKKKPEFVTVTLRYPKTARRFHCDHSVWRISPFTGKEEYLRAKHKLEEGDILTFCSQKYCHLHFCQLHWEEHVAKHTLIKLAQ